MFFITHGIVAFLIWRNIWFLLGSIIPDLFMVFKLLSRKSKYSESFVFLEKAANNFYFAILWVMAGVAWELGNVPWNNSWILPFWLGVCLHIWMDSLVHPFTHYYFPLTEKNYFYWPWLERKTIGYHIYKRYLEDGTV